MKLRGPFLVSIFRYILYGTTAEAVDHTSALTLLLLDENHSLLLNRTTLLRNTALFSSHDLVLERVQHILFFGFIAWR